MNILAANNENGVKGEKIAAEYLLEKGHFIVARNWRAKKLEIDIITQFEGLMIFIEVKTRLINGLMSPEEAMTRKKQRFLIKAANEFYLKYEIKLECRFDVIAVRLDENKHFLDHYQHAFYPRPK